MANGKTCKQCSKDLTGRQESFCSDDCRTKFHNENRKKVRKCPNCGKETTKKYCCKECGISYRNNKRKKTDPKTLEEALDIAFLRLYEQQEDVPEEFAKVLNEDWENLLA